MSTLVEDVMKAFVRTAVLISLLLVGVSTCSFGAQISVGTRIGALPPRVVAGQTTNIQTQKLVEAHYLGVASWYGIQHQGRPMANGQKFDRHQLTAACWYFPLGTTIRVVNLENGKSTMVVITDRGPNLGLDRVIDLSEAAADKLGYIREGLTSVFLFPVVTIEPEQAKIASDLIEPFSNEVSGLGEQTADSSE